MNEEIKKIYEKANKWYESIREELIRELEPLARAYVASVLRRR